MNSFCLHCRTGQEQTVVDLVSKYVPDIQLLFPKRIISEKKQGIWQQREKVLLPGYVFLYSNLEPYDLPSLRGITHHLFQYLRYDDKLVKLQGSDAEYAGWVYTNHGQIKSTQFIHLGDTIKIIAGPLLDRQGQIVRLDKHKRRVWVKFDFDGQTRIICLGAEFIDATA